jgi:hypothetical protein
MGQSASHTPSATSPTLTKSQHLFLSLSKTLPPLSLQDYNTIFSSLADRSDDQIEYWKEDTLSRFLEVPTKIGSLLFKSCSYLAALPSLEDVPVPLERERLGVAVMVLTQRVPNQVLTQRECNRLLFNSFAEVEGESFVKKEQPGEEEGEGKEGTQPSSSYGPQIPVNTMVNLILFLLSVTTASAITSPESTLSATSSPITRHAAVQSASSIITAIQSYSKRPSSDCINYDSFRAFLERDAPYFFDPLVPLFSKFLYDKHKWGANPPPRDDWIGALECEESGTSGGLLKEVLPQLSMMFPKERRIGKLVLLYAGSRDGFSMGMFESKVLKYPGRFLF